MNPFLEVIRSPETSGPITGVALTSIRRILDQDIIGAHWWLPIAWNVRGCPGLTWRPYVFEGTPHRNFGKSSP